MGNTNATKRCEASTSEVDHDAPRVFGTVAYVACGKPVAWFVETERGREYHACEQHAWDALLYNGSDVSDLDGNEATLCEEQGLRVSA